MPRVRRKGAHRAQLQEEEEEEGPACHRGRQRQRCLRDAVHGLSGCCVPSGHYYLGGVLPIDSLESTGSPLTIL